jgi:phosphotransferase system HPr (HPr) family protein
MIGIVVVSHSIALAQAAVALSLEMVPGSRPPIAIAAGAGEGILGTDATRVADAIDEVSGPSGVLVLMDLGSAVMSAEMALEFRSSQCEVVLSRGPFVEGLLAAIVQASGGATLAECAAEAEGALEGKRAQLPALAHTATTDKVAEALEEFSEDLQILNPDGLHARPISTLVTAVQGFDAQVTLSLRGKTVAANSMMGVMSLGGRLGDVVTVAASGVQAKEAFERVRSLFLEAFGELPGAE